MAKKEPKYVALMYEFHLPNLSGVCNLYVIKSLRLCEWLVLEGGWQWGRYLLVFSNQITICPYESC